MFCSGNEVYNTPAEQAFIDEHYPQAENISIDYAILEQADAIYTLPATFDWNDLGTWGALYDKLDKDSEQNAVVQGRMVMNDAKGNLVRSSGNRIVVLDGLEDFIVVDHEDVLLIFPKSKQQEIKQIRSQVKDEFGDQYA